GHVRVPTTGTISLITSSSSPPRRGCSVRPVQLARHERVLPADAGVFRGLFPGPRAPCRPPRRRGGVPAMAATGRALDASSPPTRGCSVPVRLLALVDVVLPAEAGVLRRAAAPEPGAVLSRPTRGCSVHGVPAPVGQRAGYWAQTSSACGQLLRVGSRAEVTATAAAGRRGHDDALGRTV